MPDNTVDPSGNTEAFRAFSTTPEEPAAASKTPLLIGVAVLAVIAVAVIVWLVA